jgi:uncharacterized protein YndB with AHSA1/START domain
MGWIILLAIILAFLFYVMRKPDSFRIERQISINAPAADVFRWINNVRRFNEWNPWAQMDPTSTITYSGPEEGPKASYTWLGKKTGEGSMTLIDEKPPNEVSFALSFIRPWKGNNKTTFQIHEGSGATNVSWAMTGPSNFFNKLFTTFMSMDKMVGKDFEKGLATLKEKVEAKKLN